MYTLQSLKPILTVTDATVGCPVIGCDHVVKRQRSTFKTTPEFLCSAHGIYISPSTFEYKNVQDNLLWKAPEDTNDLESIMAVKRESRMARDNSEDAVTWNFFRYLEKTGLADSWLTNLAGSLVKNSRIIYWSYDHACSDTWPVLVRAREEFGELPQQGSEPDIIVEADNAVFWIEAKFLSTNETAPSDPNALKKYLSGGGKWYSQVINANFETIAVKQKLYELTRLWLLGSWAADKIGKRYYLVNLVRETKEQSIQESFGQHINADPKRSFLRITWEDIYRFISQYGRDDADRRTLMSYVENKAAGYSPMRRLQTAFTPQQRNGQSPGQ